MKKLSLIAVLLFSAVAVHAQPADRWYEAPVVDMMTRAVIILFCMYLISSFILTFVRMILDHRIKQRMLEKGVSDDVARNFLHTDVRDVKGQTMKWFIIFLGIGIGFVLVKLTQPLGIHSIAIICFCIAFGYLAYYFFIRKIENKQS